MPQDHAIRQTELVADLTEQYSRLTGAGIEKFARAVPRGLFLAVDRITNYHLTTEPTSETTAKKATAIKTAARSMPAKKTTTAKKPATKKKASSIKTVTRSRAAAKKPTPTKATPTRATGIGAKAHPRAGKKVSRRTT